MTDINRWYECKYENPKKKGKYLLMVGIRNKIAGYTELGIIESFWNGYEWGVKDSFVVCKWKYMKPGELDKYPNFEKNLRRVSL